MELKKLRETQERIAWPAPSHDLPVVTWESCTSIFATPAIFVNSFAFFAVKKQSATRSLILVSGFIHDVSTFRDAHPGGAHLLTKYVGEDATAAFFGGVYDHSNAAHNVRPAPALVTHTVLTQRSSSR